MRVLIVEDEKRLAATLRDLMEMNGFTADVCYDGESGLDNALSGIYDVMILDVMLPKKDGFTVLRELRKAGGTVPVLMLTARSELMDKVTGLDSGADYYLTKPFEPRELIACVRALSRRTPEIREDENLTCGGPAAGADGPDPLAGGGECPPLPEGVRPSGAPHPQPEAGPLQGEHPREDLGL